MGLAVRTAFSCRNIQNRMILKSIARQRPFQVGQGLNLKTFFASGSQSRIPDSVGDRPRFFSLKTSLLIIGDERLLLRVEPGVNVVSYDKVRKSLAICIEQLNPADGQRCIRQSTHELLRLSQAPLRRQARVRTTALVRTGRLWRKANVDI
jgi:hypothetical protein